MIKADSLSYEDARKALDAGRDAARRFGRQMAFAVVDNSGHLIAALRDDGTPPRVLKQAIRKAYSAAVMERNTLSFKRDLAERGGALDQWGDPDLTTLHAGLLVRADDRTLGAVGAGGSPPEMDEEIARMMVRAMGFAPVTDERLALKWRAAPARGGAPVRQVARIPIPDSLAALGQEPVCAVRLGDHVLTSGVPGIDPETGALPDDPERQFDLAFANMRRLLEESGVAGPDAIGLINVYIPARDYRRYINKPWLELFPGASKPARKTNQAPLPRGMAVQVQACAYAGAIRQPLEIPGLAHRDPLPMGAKVGPLVYSSVIGGDDPATGKPVAGAEAQIECAFENARALMRQAGGDVGGINHLWVFLPRDFRRQKTMLDAYLRMFPDAGARPARKTVPYDLPEGAHIQIQLTGVIGAARTNYEVPGVGHHDPIPMGSRIGDILHSSGVYAVDPASGKTIAGGLEAQIDLSLDNVRALMQAAKGSLDNIAALTVLVRDYADAPPIVAKLRRLFPDWEKAPALRFVNYHLPPELLVQFHVTGVFP